METFKIGDYVCAKDESIDGKIVDIEGNIAHVEFRTARGGGCLPFELTELEYKPSIKVASTREIIEKLQKYEKENGIGAILGISTVNNGNRTVEYRLRIANDSDYNRVFCNNGKYKETEIEISSIEDLALFEN